VADKSREKLEVDAWEAFHSIRTSLLPPLVRHLNEQCGISEAEYLVLRGIRQATGLEIRPSRLSEVIGWEMDRLSHQISRMEAKGLVKRRACPDDARSFFVGFTDNGLEIINNALPIQMGAVRKLFAQPLTDAQLEELVAIAHSITSNLQAENLS
jgi:DNA-binding MarR family transcriptional regulator